MIRSLTPEERARETRDMARRAMRLANTLVNAADRARLLRYAEQLHEDADRVEHEAHSPASRVVAPRPASNDANNSRHDNKAA
jgi:hypothetical protein